MARTEWRRGIVSSSANDSRDDALFGIVNSGYSKVDIAGDNNREIAASRELHPGTFRMLSTS